MTDVAAPPEQAKRGRLGSTLLSGAVAGLGLRVVTAVATPLGLFFAARSLTVADFSIYAAALAAGTTIGLLMTLQARELMGRSDAEERPAVWAASSGSVHLTILLAVVLVAVGPVFGLGRPLATAIGVLIVAQPLESVAAGDLLRRADALRLALVQTSIPLLRLAGFFALFLAGSTSLVLFVAWIGMAQIIPSLTSLGRFGTSRLAGGWKSTGVERQVRAGVALTLVLSASIVITRSDVAMLRLLDDDGPSGEYLVVLQVVDVPWLIVGAVLTFLIPALRQRDAAGQRDLLKRLLLLIGGVMSVAAISVSALVPWAASILLSRPLVMDSWTVAIAAGSTILAGIFFLLTQFLVVQRRDAQIGWISAAGAVGNVAANLVLIPQFGSTGAASATFLAYAFLVSALFMSIGEGSRVRSALAPLVVIGVAVAATVIGHALLEVVS